MNRSILATLVFILVGSGAPPLYNQGAPPVTQAATQGAEASSLAIASFNIQFLGQSAERDNLSLAFILRDFDVVVVQELLAPPFEGRFPDGTPFKPDVEAAAFFSAMEAVGFSFELSTEDTGPGNENHTNSFATEWWVVFYKAGRLEAASGLPTEFLEEDRTHNEHFERVPYAFAFRTPDSRLDFVLISVHLRPGSTNADRTRRLEELTAIRDWVDDHDDQEKDFIIVGDMNLEDCEEVQTAAPAGFRSLNDECRATNTNVNVPRPYDNVMYRPSFTSEIDRAFDFRVFNLIEAMRPTWNSADPYPGGSVNPIGLPGYDHGRFRMIYSDHDPVVFELKIPAADDD